MVILTRVRWYLIVTLICISLVSEMLSIFSCACWPSVCLLWKSACLGLVPIFWLGCFFTIEFYAPFVYFGHEALVSHMICKYFFLVCRFSFHFVQGLRRLFLNGAWTGENTFALIGLCLLQVELSSPNHTATGWRGWRILGHQPDVYVWSFPEHISQKTFLYSDLSITKYKVLHYFWLMVEDIVDCF